MEIGCLHCEICWLTLAALGWTVAAVLAGYTARKTSEVLRRIKHLEENGNNGHATQMEKRGTHETGR